MRLFLVLPTWLVVGSIALAPSLSAQDLPTWQLYGGLGLELVSTRDGSRFTPGPTAQFGIVRQAAGSRFGARLDATYFQRDYTYAGWDGNSTALGASVGAMYDLGTSGWRPYVLGALGMYELSPPGGVPNLAKRSSAALIGGFGLRRAIGRARVFGELRYHYMTNGQDMGPHKLFLTFGIRF